MSLVVDTGASATMLPRALGLAVDDRLGERVRVLGGRAAVERAFAPRVWLGAPPGVDGLRPSGPPTTALDLRAVDLGAGAVGLLGGDTLMEHRTLLSGRLLRMELAPARWGSARRARWRGRACESGPCIEARLVRCPLSRGRLDDTCVEVAVDPSITAPLAIDVRLFDERGSLRPRAMTVVFPAGDARTDGLALPTLPAPPTRLAIRVRRPSPFDERDCGREKRGSAVCWWN